MSDRLEPPSAQAALLFDAERARPGIDGDQAARILARVGATVGAAALVSATAGSAAGATAAAHAGTAAKLGLTAKAAPWIAVAFLAGGGTGAAVHAVAIRPAGPVAGPLPSAVPPRMAPASSGNIELPPLVPSGEPSSPVVDPPPMTTATRPTSSRPETADLPALAPSADTSLAGERALIDRARMALARGQTASALDALDAHRRQFPQGRLTEEREALAIQSLAASGRTAEARARASAFQRARPNSVFLPAIELAVGRVEKNDAGQ